ncbi:MAG: lipoprotein-releasing system ATP-binding protein LolD [Candidatus Thorarchaeota archaeon]|nr:MAG: lipoprotein-releasing system ATP-binding protein LolD [Candidatus Thorarchaeota archaeon]
MVDDDHQDAVDYAKDDLSEDDFPKVKHAVKLVDVTRTYRLGKKEIEALKRVNLEVALGDLVVISGRSGSGKTTLLNIIGAIDLVTSGRLFVMDVPINDYDETFRSSFRLGNTGFIFQSYNLVSTLTAIENVLFPMQLSAKSSDELETEAMALLERVEMSDRADHLPWQLSSGEQQRVAIARAMANDPPIILADEPTANLDGESGQMVRDLLLELNKEGKAVIIMTHDERIIDQSGARRFRMESGELHDNV